MTDLILARQTERLACAVYLRRLANRATDLATRSTLAIARTPLELGTPGSLNRYLETLATKGEHAARRKAWSLRASRLADEVQYGPGGAATSTTGDRWLATAFRRCRRASRP